jgi:hypothetical protein
MPRKKRDESDADGLTGEGGSRVEPTPGKTAKTGTRGRKSNATIEKELAEQFTVLLGLGTMLWATRDAVCAPALADESEVIAKGVAHYAAKNKHARKFATGLVDTTELIPLVFALVRFGGVVYSHHSGKPFPDTDVHEGFAHGNAPFDLTGQSL